LFFFQLEFQKKLQDYIIIAEIPEKNILRSANVFTIEKKKLVVIQTDKSVYKAGDNVQFRVLVIDKDTKPYRFDKMSVSLTDGNKNKVNFVRAPKSPIGLYESSYLLSDEAVFGKWGIHVKVDDDKQFKTENFEVRDYVLPRFQAVIDTNSMIMMSDGNLQAKVYARYSFGGYVQGKANVNVKVLSNRSSDKPTHEFNQEVQVNSSETLNFNFENDFGVFQFEAKNFFVKISLIFEEKLTKKTMSTEKVVAVRTEKQNVNPEQLEIIAENKFKPGLPYKVQVIVRNKKGQFVMNQTRLFYTIQFYNKETKKCILNPKKDSYFKGEIVHYNASITDGVADLSIETQNENNAMHIMFCYDQSVVNKNVIRAPSRSREYLETEVSREK
jgi:MG2 domain/Macroglobulin domain MG3/Macroglobulin domain MG4